MRSGGAIEKELLLARVARERGRALELHARLVETAELHEEVAAHRARPPATPGSPSTRRCHGPPAPRVRARQGCGPDAAPPRTARAASSPRPRSPSSLR